ncbi:MAG: helix-turn-helix domain-containing protein, partial [Candidatus Sulfotelmatobacter sp.]
MSELMTVPEVAALLNVSEETVTRRFAKVKGVIDLGSPETPKKRRYRVLRIPQSVVEKYVLSKGG